MRDLRRCQLCDELNDRSVSACSWCGAALAEGRDRRFGPRIGRGIVAGIAMVVFAILISGCTDGVDPGRVTEVPGGTEVPGNGDGAAGEAPFSEVVLYSDPADPRIALVEFDTGDGFPIEAIEYLGTKVDDEATVDQALIHATSSADPLLLRFDELGRPEELSAADGSAFKIDYVDAETALVHFLTPNGDYGVVPVPLDEEVQGALDRIVDSDRAHRIPSAPLRSEAAPAHIMPWRANQDGDLVAIAPGIPLQAGAEPEESQRTVSISSFGSIRVRVRTVDEAGTPGPFVTRGVGITSVECSGVPCDDRIVSYVSHGQFIDLRVFHHAERQWSIEEANPVDINACEKERRVAGWWNWGAAVGIEVIGVGLAFLTIEAPPVAGLIASVSTATASLIAAQPPPELTCTEVAAIRLASEQLLQEIIEDETIVTVCVSHPLIEFPVTGTNEDCLSTDPVRPFESYDARTLRFAAYSEEFLFEGEPKAGNKVCPTGGGGGLQAPLPNQETMIVELAYAPPGGDDTCEVSLVSQPLDGQDRGPTPSPPSGYYAVQLLSDDNRTLSVRSVADVDGRILRNCDFLHGGLCGDDDPPAELRILGGPFETQQEGVDFLCARMTNIRPPALAAGLIADFEGETVSTEVGCPDQ